ncbi:MAG: efflux transporter periplasmic adaptor subunit [Rhodobacteraceae bacterium GWE1_64_9]|nr:MAG: efflux transporter periplasmic adaptor subunit [Rhodobacteraceae bacterium GWE1_64_9]OHC49785.1 MAG: efflux transporter periplasmic adaptor subunit [Rhodobacteraceae bacterium GWF1_65_7]HBD89257.1 efflux transporter periplasmic adaptor subunit [Gemmobacter sp.]HBU16759.1 efflux transporter periplasmic adaptor subunit [Gemmobacter sp.]
MKQLLLSSVIAVSFGLVAPAALAQQGEMPPAAVSFVEMTPMPLPVINELPGRVSATRQAEVRPRISGIVLERVFEQGSIVKAGDVLYRIDPAQYRVRVASAEGALAKARAAQMNARDQERRAQQLRDRNITANVDLENATTTLMQADADVTIAEAALAEAKLNLDYTEVTAPISGVIGRALVTEGALVSAQTEVLATIQQLDPVYVDFTQSSSALLKLRRALAAGELVATAPNEAQMRLLFDDGSEYDQPGRLLFSEATVDALTGQVTLRGEFPNSAGDLLPGLYVRVAVEQAIRRDALSVPQMAVQRDAQGNAMVYVIGAENKVQARPVVLGTSVGATWIVESGLQAGDKVVVEGAQKMIPDAVVVPEPWQAPQAAAN